MIIMAKYNALSLLGLAKRAGKVCLQEEANMKAIRKGTAKVLLLAADAGAATAKKYYDKCNYYRVPVIVFASKEELGQALGTSPRTAVAVTDEGFAASLRKLAKEKT